MSKQSLRNQSGFGQVVVLVLLFAVLAVIIFIGYQIYQNRPVEDLTSGATSDTSQTAAPEIKSTGDLDKASATLDQIDTDSTDQSDASALNAELDTF